VNPLDGIAFQRALESRAYELGGGNYDCPRASCVGDFIKPAGARKRASSQRAALVHAGREPTDLGPALAASSLPDLLPSTRSARRLPAFEKQIKGFSMKDAVLTGVETRTSSPLRITRGRDWQSLNVKGLYPAGEGAGYAGGIMSAGVDGIEVAEAVGASILGVKAPGQPR
jgi:uncharacterized FAD-dependent dehydrogenase